MDIDRRTLTSAVAATVAAALLSACSPVTPTPSRTRVTPVPRATPSATATSAPPTTTTTTTTAASSRYTSRAIGDNAVLTNVPLGNRQVALTVDDGVSSDVVGGYARLCKETGMRLTFFGNGCYDSWSDNAKVLAPLIESGQIVIGNHTWNHKALTTLSSSGIADEMTRNERHFKNLFGIDMKPFMRPPYGYYNHRVKAVLDDLGYPACTMWYGTLGDDQIITPAAVMKNARQWMNPGALVIGHANHPAVLNCYTQLHELIESRKLTTVTVADVYCV